MPKVHSTNYFNTLILIAEDSKTETGTIPPLKGDKKTVAYLQYELLAGNAYKYNSDEALFSVFATRKDFIQEELEEERAKYFSKGQPCFRASPLTKSYGWGIHSNAEGKIALVAAESELYESLMKDEKVKKVLAMRSKRKS